MAERTLVLLKPDAVQRGVVGALIGRFEQRGLQVLALKLTRVSRSLAERHYAEHRGKAFYDALVAFITAGPIVAMVLQGPGAVGTVRSLMGATDPAQAAPGTIRGDLASEVTHNLVHGSDSPERARAEIGLFFASSEILDWERSADAWLLG